MTDLEQKVFAQKWFYPFTLNSGRSVSMYISDEVALIHTTRLEMMNKVLEPVFRQSVGPVVGMDISCHQGFFGLALARRCQNVIGIDIREHHIESAKVMAEALGVKNIRFCADDAESMPSGKYEPSDIVLNFGLMYNVSDPIGVLRRCFELTKTVLLVETQTTMVELGGFIDSGSYRWNKQINGIFAIVEGNPENSEGSSSNVSLVPSYNGLVWLLYRLGFSRVETVPVPGNGYEQLVNRKRVMLAAYR